MALDGVTWPQGNPKTLRVAFSTKEDMKKMQEGAADGVMGRLGAEEGGRGREVKEWDRNKVDQEREREKEREERRSTREVRERSREKTPTPAVVTKSLEELFNKTTAGPAIYWRPLSEGEIQAKIQERAVKVEEAKRATKVDEAKIQK